MKRIVHVLLPLLLPFFAACGGAPSDEGHDDASDGTGLESGAPETSGGEAGPTEPTRANGRNFSIPVPAGFRRVLSGTIADMMRDEVLTPGGVILMAEASEVAGATAGSIVVSPTAADISSDAVDEPLCAQLAEIVARQHEATVERSGMVVLPFGSTCQWTLRVGTDDDRLRLGTVFAAHAEDWIVTCNYDERDDPAATACSQVLGGWAFGP
jgi:hypothetical protein